MKDIFTYNIDLNKTAYINWRTKRYDPIDNMIVIADGYSMSALLLAQELLENNDNKDADIVIFPIMFNANHAIELYLKSIVWSLNILLESNLKKEGSHDIKQIFSTVKSKVNKFEYDRTRKEQFKNLTKNLECYLNELYIKIRSNTDSHKDNTDFCRYPFTTKYTNHFYIEEFDNVVVDLENFISRYTVISNNLSRIASDYSEKAGCFLESKVNY
jgi:hypothetical protein